MSFPLFVRFASVVPLMMFMMACKVESPPIQPAASFSLEYRVNKGLDCAMAQDCGFQIEVAQTGAFTRSEDEGTGTLSVSIQQMLSPQQMNDLYQLLDETGFFDFPDLLPVDNPKAGAGSAYIKYTAWPSGTSKQVTIMKGGSLPEEAHVFMSRLDSFFSFSSIEGREQEK